MSCYFTWFYCLLDLSCVECYVNPCILCVALLMDLFVLCVACLTVFVNCLVKEFAICMGVVIILLLNVMEVFMLVEVLCWIDRLWSSKYPEVLVL